MNDQIESASKRPGADSADSSDTATAWIWNKACLALILVNWVIGGVLISLMWINAPELWKYFWGFTFWAWLLLSPYVLALMAGSLSIMAVNAGNLGLCQRLAYVAYHASRGWPLIGSRLRLFAGMSDLGDYLYAVSLQASGEFALSVSLMRQRLAKVENSPKVDEAKLKGVLADLAESLNNTGDLREAAVLLKRAAKPLAPGKPFTFQHGIQTEKALRGLGGLFRLVHDYEACEKSYRLAIQCMQAFDNAKLPAAVKGVIDLNVAQSWSALAEMYTISDNLEEAERCFEKGLSHDKVIGKLMNSNYWVNLAELRIKQGKLQEAADLLAKTADYHKKMSKGSPLAGINFNFVDVELDIAKGNCTEGARKLAYVTAVIEKSLGAEHPQMISVLMLNGDLLEKTGDLVAAAEMRERSEVMKKRAQAQVNGK